MLFSSCFLVLINDILLKYLEHSIGKKPPCVALKKIKLFMPHCFNSINKDISLSNNPISFNIFKLQNSWINFFVNSFSFT